MQLQNQVAMNQQLMKRKEDMEWQLMSVLAKVQACHLHCMKSGALHDNMYSKLRHRWLPTAFTSSCPPICYI